MGDIYSGADADSSLQMIKQRVWRVPSTIFYLLRFSSVSTISNSTQSAVRSTTTEVPSKVISGIKSKSTKHISAKRKQTEEAWKTLILNNLHAELEGLRNETRPLLNIRNCSTQLIRFAIDDDVLSIISFLDNFLRSMMKVQTKEVDEFLAISTLLVQRNMLPFINGQRDPNDKLATSICYSFGKIWRKIKLTGTDTQIAAIILYDSFQKWSKLRGVDEDSKKIENIVEAIHDKITERVSVINIEKSTLIWTDGDREVLTRTGRSLQLRIKKNQNESLGYDPELKLTQDLQIPCTSAEYLTNPFALKGITKAHYMKQMDLQLKLESAAWLRVNNFWKDRAPDIVESAEDLIRAWKWRDHIAEQLDRRFSDVALYQVKVCLSALDKEELVDHLLEAVTACCSLGQYLVPVGIFQNNLVFPILRQIHTKFISKLGIDVNESWRRVMLDYLQYFEDEEISRTHTHREWWSKVCQRHAIPANYQSPFPHYDSDIRKKLIAFFTDVLFEACKFPRSLSGDRVEMLNAFSLKNVAVEEESRITDQGRYNLAPMVHLNPKMMEKFDKHQFNHILFPTEELPMTVPPRPWTDYGNGGPQFNRSKQILRVISEYKVDINKEMITRLENNFQARPVFDALNQLGSTPWIINESMLKVLGQVFSMSNDPSQKDFLESLAVPLKASAVHVPSAEDVLGEQINDPEVPKEKWREFYKLQNESLKNRNETNSLWYWMMYRIVLAEHFRGQTLFFPHNMDFRGRVYPISPYLSHMGDDVNRCILKFAKGKPLGPNGLSWLKLHCINLTGKYKRQSVTERHRVAEQVLPDILDSANNPLSGKRWWVDSDEPWQTLAACMELRDALSFPGDPSEFISHLPVHQDGSCNGLQHYAALGRDKQGGSEVNLLPSEIPSDVYSSVAARVEQKRLQDEQYGPDMELLQRLRVAMPQSVPRKVIKQTVMTTVYGVTMYGANLQIKRQLKALEIDNDDIAKFAAYLAKKTFASLHDAFTSSMQLKDWFRTCAKGTNELLRTVEWVTPLGLPVVQPYVVEKMTNKRLIRTPKTTKQIDAFPPNFVHSLDSTHMMLTSLECSRRGMTFAAVHDCFWTHASTVDKMNEICRQQFVHLHDQPLVQQLSDWFLQHYLPPSLLSHMPQEQKDKFIAIFTPKVKPGDLDINEVKKSVYFFS